MAVSIGFNYQYCLSTDLNPFVDLFMQFPSFNIADSYERLEEGSNKKKEILSEITEIMMHRAHLDSSIELIGNLIFGSAVAPSVLKTVRPSGQALVDDWVQAFESHCGSLTQYGMKYMRAFANICNEGVSKDAMEEACGNVCGSYNSAKWSPFIHSYSA
ncbi:vacuolar-processing enzyme-like [Zingiber officinale]|uniref:vacuolar-processing enzyme-like n=1 Tax=Zingiber officinale TaxID=94328 RepID=UPI001C4CB419|nr:vacuolar-processing enzyme-like [Zingiber officinale]